MVEPDALAALAQLGTAGLIGWMWLTERRAAADRERQIQEAHQAIIQDRTHLDILIRALESNTRAITALEAGQREFLRMLPHPGLPVVAQRSPQTPAAEPSSTGVVPAHAVH